MAEIRIVVVDDHQVVRRGLVSFLNAVDGMCVVGEASDGEDAVRLIGEVRPDVAVLDMQMPGLSGADLIAALRTIHPPLRVLILSSFSEGHRVTEALRAGAIGYLVKSAPLEQIVSAIRAAHHGDALLSREAAQQLIRPADEPAIALKPRELEVLTLMCRGLTNPQIAARLFLSRATVKYYVSEILTKFNLSTRTEAVAYAIERGLVPRDP